MYGDAADARLPPLRPRERLGLAVILVNALGIRLVYALWIDGEPYESPIFDGTWYDRAARDLLAGNGFVDALGLPTAFFPPGYPALLAAAYGLFGERYETARVLNALLATGTCWLVFAVGRRLYGGGVGLVASALLAFWPGEVFYTSLTLSEPAFTFALTGCLYLFLVWSRAPPGRQLVFGVLLGLAALVRGIALLYLAVPVVTWLATLGWTREALRRSALAALGLGLAIAPWTLRNQLTMGYPILIASDGPNALVIAHSPIADGSQSAEIWDWRRENYGEIPLYNPEAEVALARADLAAGLRYLLTHPRRELELIPKRLVALFYHDHYAYRFSTIERTKRGTAGRTYRLRPKRQQRVVREIADAYFFALLALAALGLTRVSSRAWSAGLVVPFTPLFFVLAHGLLFWGDPRFHAPFLPCLALLAAATLAGGRSPWRLTPADLSAPGARRPRGHPRASSP